MITAEEKTQERFPDRNNRDNSNRQNHQNNGHQDRKHGPNNTVVVADKAKEFSKPRKFDDIENMHCIWHPNGNHTTEDCRIFIDRYTRKGNNGERKEDNHKKNEDNQEDKGFQKYKGTAAVNLVGVLGSRSKHQDKLALRTIMAVEPAIPRYLNWSQYPIQFSREDQWTSVGNAGHYPLVLDPTIAGMTVMKVLINGGAKLNIIFLEMLRKMGLELAGIITPTTVPFYGIVPSKATMPLGQITLPVTFGTPTNYRTEFIKFEIADFKSSYHAILGRPALAKFMVIPHYPYLLLKMPGPNNILSLQGDLKRAFDCDVQAIQIAAKAQAASRREEIATVAAEMNPEELEIPAKRPSILAPPKEADMKQIDLGTGDPSKTMIINAHLPAK
jgi:hypothetical protein